MQIQRVWEMPNKYTFKMRCVSSLLHEEMSGVWADPFCGLYSPATLTNDADSNIPAGNHMDGLEFLRTIPDANVDGVLFDPPYSKHQACVSYKAADGGKAGKRIYASLCQDEIMRIVRSGGKAICFGWNSCGIGKVRGFELQRVLIICHGGHHNDTIVTVEEHTALHQREMWETVSGSDAHQSQT